MHTLSFSNQETKLFFITFLIYNNKKNIHKMKKSNKDTVGPNIHYHFFLVINIQSSCTFHYVDIIVYITRLTMYYIYYAVSCILSIMKTYS